MTTDSIRVMDRFRFIIPTHSVYFSVLFLLSCAGSPVRAGGELQSSFAMVNANMQTFPEGADRSLPQVKEFVSQTATGEKIKLAAWSRDFGQGSALLLEFSGNVPFERFMLKVNNHHRKLIQGNGCWFTVHANSPLSKQKFDVAEIRDGNSIIARFEIPILYKEYPVSHSQLTVKKFSNQSKPMSEKTRAFIAESIKKKQKAFRSNSENLLTGAFHYPRDEHKITSPFFIKRVYKRFKIVHGKKKKLSGKTSYHGGTDLRGQVGAPIFAIADGIVNLADHLYYEGNVVILDHGDGVLSGYMHQSELLVKQGERVKAGQLIGRAGSTGMVTGPHLHLFLSVHGVKTDPLSLIVLPIPAK